MKSCLFPLLLLTCWLMPLAADAQQPGTTPDSAQATVAPVSPPATPQLQAHTREDSLYILIDSLNRVMQADPAMAALGQLLFARLSIGKIDIDLSRIIAINPYESVRLGIGLYTNDKLSRYVSIGGWMGYGFRDDRVKYGASARWYPNGDKDHWLEAYYQDNYQNPGSVRIHRDLDRMGLRNWTLSRVDRIREAGIAAHTRISFLELTATGLTQDLLPQYEYIFDVPGSDAYDIQVAEANIGLSFAYGEQRVPFLGRHISLGTKFPILYGRFAYGSLQSGTYATSYWRALAAISYKINLKRVGKAYIHIEAGTIRAEDDKKPLPRSFLLAGNGYRNDAVYWYAQGGFITMYPYTYYSDRYASLLLRYDFNWRFYKTAYSNPYLSVAYNALTGAMHTASLTANPGITVPTTGYQEAGALLNSILRVRYFNAAYLNFNAGVFYHLSPTGGWQQNGKIVVGTNISIL